MHYKQLPIWFAAVLAVAGCSTMESQIRTSGSMGPDDSNYVSTAYDIVQLDQQEGKLAATKAADPRVLDLSNQLMSQANILDPQLQSAIKVEGSQPPTHLSSSVTAEVNTLNGLNGPAFDRQYVADELAAHQRAVAVFQKEDTATKDGAMRTLVETALPTVKNNLAKLQVLSGDIQTAHS